MLIYKCTKQGYVECINTDGNYKPPGWFRSRQAAEKAFKSKTKKEKQIYKRRFNENRS